MYRVGPEKPERERRVLSCGHAAGVLFSIGRKRLAADLLEIAHDIGTTGGIFRPRRRKKRQLPIVTGTTPDLLP